MKNFRLPGTGIKVPAVVAGMMRIEDKTDAEIRDLFDTALTAGVNFFDHADIYGSQLHRCEERFAQALRLSPAQRAEVILQSKAGIVPGDGTYYDFSKPHLLSAVDGSLRALKTDYLDLLLLHRPDALVEPEEVAAAFDELSAAGKVRAFGVSNHTGAQIELLRRYVRQPLVVNQLQLSIVHAPMIAQGLAMNMADEPQSVSRDLGVLDYCRLNAITVQAWSPFQAGYFTGVFLGSPKFPELNEVIDRLAAEYQVSPEAIATAWLTRHPARLQVVLGTTSRQRVASAAAGADVVLTRQEWYELYRAAGHVVP